MANKKAHIKRERIPSYTFIKEFDDFDEGYSHMISLIPDIAMYGGENTNYDSVVNSLLNTISESIPSPKNSNFPNTMSLSINSKEVGFLTDDQMAFGWKIFLQKNNDSLAFQFRITFLSLSISKKKSIDVLMENGWKEKDLSDKQSRFWNEIHTNSRPSYKDGVEQKDTKTKQPEKNKVVPKVPVKNDGDELVEVMFPGTNQKVWIKKKDLGNKYPPSKMEVEIQKNDDFPEPIKESVVVAAENNATEAINTIENVQQPVSQPVKQNNTEQIVVTTNKNKSIGQQVKIIDESQTEYTEPSRDISNCAIYPSEGKATFRIVHFGNEFIYNINDRQDGIFVDRNSRTIKIDNVLYNYQSFKVLQLDEDFDNQSSTYVPGIQNKMREHGPLDDSVFVPRSIIEKANNPVLDSSETVVVAKKKQEAEAKQNKMLFAQQQQPQQPFNTMTMPKMNNNGKPALVLNAKPAATNQNVQTGMAQQTVRVSDNRTH